MSDETTWHAPGAAAPVPPAPAVYAPPSFSPPAAPGDPLLPGSTSYAPPHATGGWRPPPKPGLIPLRPIGFGTLLGGGFQVMRRNPRPTFGFAALLYGVITVSLAAAFIGIISYYTTAISNATSTNDVNLFSAGLTGTVLVALLIPVALSVIASAILQGVISLEVARGTLGEKLKVRGLWRLARGRIGALIGWAFLLIGAFLVAYIGIIVVLVLIGLIGSAAGAGGVAVTIIAGILLFGALIVGAAWIYVKTSLVPCVILLERKTVRQSIARSWRLTNGFFWKTLGIQLLVYVIISFASQLVTLPISLVLTIGQQLLLPNGDPTSGIVAVVIAGLALGVVTIVIGAVGLVWESATVALIYIDIRMRREGLDLELLRFVEARQSGDASVADPYLTLAANGNRAPTTETGTPWA